MRKAAAIQPFRRDISENTGSYPSPSSAAIRGTLLPMLTCRAALLHEFNAPLVIHDNLVVADPKHGEVLVKLGASRDSLARMGDRAREIARPDAAEELARVCLLTAGLVSRGTP